MSPTVRNSVRIPLFVVGILLVLGVLSCMGLDRAAPIDYYRQIDEQTIAVGAGTGPTLWARVTSVTESDTTVTIEARSVAAPVPSTGDAVTELVVTLSKPLGSRRVIDGSSGLDVPARISRDDAVRIAQGERGAAGRAHIC